MYTINTNENYSVFLYVCLQYQAAEGNSAPRAVGSVQWRALKAQ